MTTDWDSGDNSPLDDINEAKKLFEDVSLAPVATRIELRPEFFEEIRYGLTAHNRVGEKPAIGWFYGGVPVHTNRYLDVRAVIWYSDGSCRRMT